MKKRNESSVVTAIMRYLQCLENLKKVVFYNRQQCGIMPVQTNGKWRSIRLGRTGVADIYVILKNGKLVWVEVKVDEGKQSLEQIEFMELVRSCGHYYWLIHDCDELEKNLKAIGVI
jgi:hypothetical protein